MSITVDWDAISFNQAERRLLILWIYRHIRRIMRTYVGEPNNNITRAQLRYDVEQFLGNVVARKGLDDYAVVCDESNNTPDDIDQGIMRTHIDIRPVKDLRYLRIQTTVSHYNSEHDMRFDRAMKGVI